MKIVVKLIALCLLLLAVVWLVTNRKPSATKTETQPTVQTSARVSTPAPVSTSNKTVMIITGQQRMSNAIRCMAYVLELANKVPNEERRDILSLGGVLFFDDCLMSKMTNGRIRITTNELVQSFSQAISAAFTNHIPADVAQMLAKTVPGEYQHWGESLQGIKQHEAEQREHPFTGLVHGFYFCLESRNQTETTMDDHYQELSAHNAPIAAKIKMVDGVIKTAGVQDAPQSDLKEQCLAHCEIRTDMYQLYGTSSPDEFHVYANNYDMIMHWRLINMFGLDDATAQELVTKLSRVPVQDQFSNASLQPPAWIE